MELSHKLLTLLALLTICYLTYLVKGKNQIFVLILPHCRLERLANLVSQPIGAMARMSQAVNNPAGFLKQFAERCCFYKVSLVPSIIAMHCLDMFADNRVTLICFSQIKDDQVQVRCLLGEAARSRTRLRELRKRTQTETEILPALR